MLDANLKAGGAFPVILPASYNALAVVAQGKVRVGNQQASTGEVLLFANDGDRLDLLADEDSHVVILAGEPLNEPVVPYGPFVMNSFEEIKQAIFDVQSGKFGPVPE